jgi:hypothetical protein
MGTFDGVRLCFNVLVMVGVQKLESFPIELQDFDMVWGFPSNDEAMNQIQVNNKYV